MKYEINKETIIKYNMQDEFPEVFKFTGWAKTKGYNTWLGYYENNILKYGVSNMGTWFDSAGAIFDSDTDRPATHEEIEKGLIAMAERLEHKFTNYAYHFYGVCENNLYGWNGTNDTIKLFTKGNWAEIIKEPLTLEQRIERIEKIHGL